MNSIPHRRLIGVLGGMGPAATIDFMSKVVAATPAGMDQEHIPMMVHCVPQIPDRSSAVQAGSDAPFLPMLAGVQRLERAGADFIAIPCNTAHFWHERLSRACGVPILHIADAVAAMLASGGVRVSRAALLATRGTVAAGIYQSRLARTFERLIVPDEAAQSLVDRTIALVKGGDVAQARSTLAQAAALLAEQGAERLLLSCTELPVAVSDGIPAGMVIDCTEALARACVAAAMEGGPAVRCAVPAQEARH